MLRVLIVEDNRNFREAFKKGLCDHFPSMVVEEAGNGEEALQKIERISPHLIFMDVRLPGVNGLKVTKKIKKDFPGITVAILTDYDLPEYRQAAMQYGADRFFVKDSFKWEEVEGLVKLFPPGIS
jgi:DNA-binding NarL/FixJ family response regulator